MPKFLQTARDKALVIVDRERPFFTPGAMSMYMLALVAEAPVIIARYLLALLVVFAVLVIEGNLHGGTEWALVALDPDRVVGGRVVQPDGWRVVVADPRRRPRTIQTRAARLPRRHRAAADQLGEAAAVAGALVRDRQPPARTPRSAATR